MSKTEQTKRAEQLKDEIKDVMLDVGANAWPWMPFALPTTDELQERKRREIVIELYGLLDDDDKQAMLPLLDELVRLGGFMCDNGVLELDFSPYYVVGRRREIEKFGDFDSFLQPFDRVFGEWDEAGLDWLALERLLLVDAGVSPTELSQLNLIDIRRYLLALPRTAVKRVNRSSKGKSRTRVVKGPTNREMEAYSLRMRGLSLAEVGRAMGCSPQAASKFVEAVKRKVSQVQARSVQAQYSLQDHDQRADDADDDDDGRAGRA